MKILLALLCLAAGVVAGADTTTGIVMPSDSMASMHFDWWAFKVTDANGQLVIGVDGDTCEIRYGEYPTRYGTRKLAEEYQDVCRDTKVK